MESSLHTLLVAIAWRYYVILRNNICGEFLPVSWLLLGNFLTYSWVFLMILENFFLVRDNFFPSRIVKSTQDTPRSHWDTVKKPMRRKQDYYDIVKKWQDMSIVKKWQELSNRHEYFWNFQKKSWSFPIYQELSGSVRKYQEVSRSCSRSLQEDIRKCQDLKFCTIRVVIRDSGTALFGQPEIHQIINTNLTRIKGNNIRGKKKCIIFLSHTHKIWLDSS